MSETWINPAPDASPPRAPSDTHAFTITQRSMRLDEAIEVLHRDLPGWWWKVGSCCISDDACIAPDFNSPLHGERLKAELFPIEPGGPLDAGFDVDQRPPGDVAGALMYAIHQAKTYLAARQK